MTTNTMDVLAELKANGYKMETPEQLGNYITALHTSSQLSHNLKGTYFNVLLAEFDAERRIVEDATGITHMTQEGLLAVLETVSKAHNVVINDALKTDAMTPQERNRATSFHRSAKSTIKKAIEADHDLADVSVGKSALAKETSALITGIASPYDKAVQTLVKLDKLIGKMSDDERVQFDTDMADFLDKHRGM